MSVGIAVGVVFFSVMCVAWSVKTDRENAKLRKALEKTRTLAFEQSDRREIIALVDQILEDWEVYE